MAEKADMQGLISTEEIVMSDMVTLKALVNLLERKGIIGSVELVDEIRALKIELMD